MPKARLQNEKPSAELSAQAVRPVVFDYRSPQAFLRDLQEFYKIKQPTFSLRQRIKNSGAGCSPALVSQILNNKRSLSRDQMPNLSRIFSLSEREFEFLDVLLRKDLSSNPIVSKDNESVTKAEKIVVKNHLLDFWLNPYVKDLASLKGFKPVVAQIHWMLKGLAKPREIERSLKLLLREGFLRVTPQQKLVVADAVTHSSNDVPNAKIRAFHKRAIRIAERGLEVFDMSERKASTTLISVNKETKEELRLLVASFQHQLSEFASRHPDGDEELVQICIHLTPVGKSYEK